MPKSVVSAGLVDFQMPVEEIAKKLVSHVGRIRVGLAWMKM